MSRVHARSLILFCLQCSQRSQKSFLEASYIQYLLSSYNGLNSEFSVIESPDFEHWKAFFGDFGAERVTKTTFFLHMYQAPKDLLEDHSSWYEQSTATNYIIAFKNRVSNLYKLYLIIILFSLQECVLKRTPANIKKAGHNTILE